MIAALFVIAGTAAGFISVWFRQHTDSLFLFNLPGTLLGDAAYVLSIQLLGDPHSAQAHYTIPWLLRIPQVYVPVSVLFWGLVGAVSARFLKARMLLWLTGIYLAAGAGVYLFVVFRSFRFPP
ncbi:MAG: hypothetical protein ABID87_05325 [Chloroflexota bacterium]